MHNYKTLEKKANVVVDAAEDRAAICPTEARSEHKPYDLIAKIVKTKIYLDFEGTTRHLKRMQP